MSTRDSILTVFQQVASEQGRSLAAMSDGIALTDCGLDSLSFAIVVSHLEDSLGVDPFATADDVEFPVTFGDFVRVYERAVA